MFVNEVNCSNYWENSVLLDDYQSSDPFDASLAPFSADPAPAGFVERAPATFSCSRENSSLSEQIPNIHDTNSRKRKYSITNKGKTPTPATSKHPYSPSPTNNVKEISSAAAAEKSESISAKKSKSGDNNNNLKESPKDYIHVRARSGQATDAHSLAERVRREKISEKMKVLQDLVPGCNKVTGKAVMLDEIINYVESLQRQVEFLSMKLATVNSRIMDLNMEALIMSDMLVQQYSSRGGSLPGSPHQNIILYPSDICCCYPALLSQPNTHTNTTIPPPEANNFSPSFGTNYSDDFRDPASQVSTFWEDELHSVVHMGLIGSNQTQVLLGSRLS